MAANQKADRQADRKETGSRVSPSGNRPVIETTRAERIVSTLICLAVLVAFGCIAVMSLLRTSVIGPAHYIGEVILYPKDNVLWNLVSLVALTLVLLLMRRFSGALERVNLGAMEAALVLFVVALGLIWVFSVRSIPEADSYSIFEAATGAALGNYSPMLNGSDFYHSDLFHGYSYFNFYPFQLGFTAFCELIYRIFGTGSSLSVQVINVFCVGLAYLALARMTRLLFCRKSAEFLAILLLMTCIQPVLFCTFVYGNIIGMCCAVWASLFMVKYLQTGSCRWVWPAALLLVIAVIVKYNNMLYLISFAVLLVVHLLIEKKRASGAIAAVLIAAVLGAQTLVIKQYEYRAEATFCEGVSQVLYLDMGLQEDGPAPGWYTERAKSIYISAYLDPLFGGAGLVADPSASNTDESAAAPSIKDANAVAWEEIRQRARQLQNPSYAATFFGKKALSQWNETTFESVWISKVKLHSKAGSFGGFENSESSRGSRESSQIASGIPSTQTEGLVWDVYYGQSGKVLTKYFDYYTQILYILFALGTFLLIVNKETCLDTVLLLLVLLGAFAYHLFFEGKSQYVLTYIPLLVPTAAYACSCILHRKEKTQ